MKSFCAAAAEARRQDRPQTARAHRHGHQGHSAELIQTEEEDPLLAYWPIGAGRAAVFASDVKDRWAADWLRWRGYGPFFSAVVRELAGQRFANWSLDLDVSPARGVSRNVRVTLDAREPDGRPKSLLRPRVRVEAGGAPRELVARQVGPGRYEASLTVDAGAVLSASLVDDTVPATAGLSRRFVPDAGAEYRFRSPDNALLSSLASSTGGKVGPAPRLFAGRAQTAAPPAEPCGRASCCSRSSAGPLICFFGACGSSRDNRSLNRALHDRLAVLYSA